MNICTACRTPLDEGATFCGECGTPVAPAYPDPATETHPAHPTRNGSGKKILVGAAAVVLLAAGVFTATKVMQDDAPAASAGPATSTGAATATPTPVAVANPTASTAQPTAMAGSTDAPAPTQVLAPSAAGATTFRAGTTHPGVGADKNYVTYFTGDGVGGTFDRVATVAESTSKAFMWAVARAYADSGADGSSVVLDGVYSPVTGKTYRMTCTSQESGAVLCTGGERARILLYN